MIFARFNIEHITKFIRSGEIYYAKIEPGWTAFNQDILSTGDEYRCAQAFKVTDGVFNCWITNPVNAMQPTQEEILMIALTAKSFTEIKNAVR